MSMAELMESITDELTEQLEHGVFAQYMNCLLYTSDAADD